MTSKKIPVYDSAVLRFPFFYKFKELLRYRDLLRNLVARDLKVRYKRSVIGFIWVMLNPLLTMGVLVFVFSTLFHSAVAHFPTYLLAGLLLWNLFAQGTVAAMTSLQANSSTIRKIHVPPSAFVFSAVGSAIVNMVFALLPFFVLALLDGLTPQLSWLYVIVPALQTAMLTIGVSLIISAMIVFFADVFEIYQVFLNLFFFLTPIMYPISILTPELRFVMLFNPLYYVIMGFRVSLGVSDLPFPLLTYLLVSTLFPLAVLAVGWLFFTRVEDKFAYHL